MKLLFFIYSLFLILLPQGCVKKTFVQKDLGNDEIQGLKYINDSAKNFITSYNEEYSTNWISLEPDWRIIVHKCTVPFKVSWSFAPDYASPKEQEFLYIK